MVSKPRLNACRVALSIAILMGTFACSNASAINSSGAGVVEKIPLDLNTTLSCGAWQEGDDFGFYRLVVIAVNQGAGDEIYLQKIKSSAESAREGVVWTQAIAELNDEHNQYQLDHAACETRSGQSVFVLSMTHEDSPAGKLERFTIFPDQKIRYLLRKKVGFK